MAYKYRSKPKKPEPQTLPRFKVTQEQEQIVPVQGKMPDSVEELRLARAFDRYKIPYDFQVPLKGGRSIRGGYILDFLIYTPRPVPVSVEGTYWHRGNRAEADKLMYEMLRNKYQTIPIVVKSDELGSQEETNDWVLYNVL